MKSSFLHKIASVSYMFIPMSNQAPEEMILGGMPTLYLFEYYFPLEHIPTGNATVNVETEVLGRNSTPERLSLFNNCKWFFK